jgi:hypothetical protein
MTFHIKKIAACLTLSGEAGGGKSGPGPDFSLEDLGHRKHENTVLPHIGDDHFLIFRV